MIDTLKHGIRRLNVFVTVVIYAAIAPPGYAALATLCYCWRKDPIRRAQRLQTLTARAYGLLHRWLTFTRITRLNRQTTLPNWPSGSCIVVANHPTLMDITAVTSLIGGACTIVKPQLYRRTMLRPLLQGLGHIEGPGTNPIDISGVLEDAIERTKWGLPILIFPEGTRSPTNQIGRFGRVAFEVACRANIPVVSLAITCDPTYLSKQVPLFQAPNPTPHLRIEVLAVDQPESAALDSRQLQKRIEARYQAWLPSVASATSDP